MSFYNQHSKVIAGVSSLPNGYTLENSLRFRSSASAYLNRTPSSAGNRQTWTWSGWIKRSDDASTDNIFGAYVGANDFCGHRLRASGDNGRLEVFHYSSGYDYRIETTQIFRDYSSWYHIIVSVDTTQSTSTDRIKIYVNGSQVTALSTTTYPSLNFNTDINNTNIHYLASIAGGYFDGYMTDINFIDGQALTANDFGEFDEDTGVWKPKRYTGSYGTNGFRLDGSGVTDSSGSGNNWTNNNLNLTTSSSTTYDLMTDVPTLTDENAANYCTVNPLDTYNGSEISDGNLSVYESSAVYSKGRGTIWVDVEDSDGWYFEAQMGRTVAGFNPGIIDDSVLTTSTWGNAGAYGIVPRGGGGGNNYDLFSGTTMGTSTGIKNNVSDNIISVAFKNGKLYFAVDGTWVLSCDPETESNPCFSGLTGLYTAYYSKYADSYKSYFNFGQRPFAYTPPTGFKALNTYNLPDSDIIVGAEHFNTVLYTGNGSTQSITGVGFKPDLLWLKRRDSAENHGLHDVIRGSTNFHVTNQNANQYTATNSVTSFDSDGFSLGNYSNTNTNGSSMAAWNWKANGSGVSNTVGSINSTVSANPTAGFSIVQYTGNGSTSSGQTVGHGLGRTPEMIITKLQSGTQYNWSCWHKDLGGNYGIWLNLTNGRNNGMWGGYANHSSTVFVPADLAYNNVSGATYINYLWASVEGFSSIGSYTGNGSANGPFVYTGFSPSWLLIKRSDAAANWLLYDNKRLGYNTNGYYLLPDGTWVEGTGADNRFDLISNGFKVRDSNQSLNVSGGTYIYAAFAENPFKNSLAR